MDAKDKITQLLRERGWSIYELAKRSGLSSTTIANMYKRNTQPTIPSLEAMCRAFGITMSQFFLEGGETGVQLVFYGGGEQVIDFSALGRAFACYWLEVTAPGEAPVTSARFEEREGCVAMALEHPEETLRAEAPAEVSRFMPPAEGLVKRFRNGGFYYEKTES